MWSEALQSFFPRRSGRLYASCCGYRPSRGCQAGSDRVRVAPDHAGPELPIGLPELEADIVVNRVRRHPEGL